MFRSSYPRMRQGGSAWLSRGFTLIELLVVVSIIALLIAILLPSLKRAREQAKSTVCLASLKGISTAGNTFAASNSGELTIPIHPLIGQVNGALGEVEWGGKAGRGDVIVGDPSQIVNSKWGTKFQRGPSTRGLNSVIYKGGFTDYGNPPMPGPDDSNWINDTNLDLKMFRCPSDKGWTGLHYSAWKNSGLSSYDHYGTSYAAVTSWIGVSGGNCTLFSNSSFLKPLSRVPNPANTVYFMENCGRFGWRINYGTTDDCQFLSGDTPEAPERDIIGWHQKPYVFNVAYVDGHASVVTMRGHNHPQARLSSYPAWKGRPTDYDFWHCVINRGKDWQLDTLPAPPVDSGIGCNTGGSVNTIEE